jgi:hypothetical protein
MVVTRALADGDTAAFRGDLAAVATAPAVGAFLAPAPLLGALRLVLAALAAAIVHAALAGRVDTAVALAALVFASGVAPSGLAAVGRRVGAGDVGAGVVAAAVLWAAMTGLFWADPVSQRLPRASRHPFRRAVLHVDPATACAFDVSRHDRFHEPEVYRDVPLASSVIERPRAHTTAAVWTAVGALAWGGVAVPGAVRARSRRAALAS